MGPAPTPTSRTAVLAARGQGLAGQVDDELGLLARDEGAAVGLEEDLAEGRLAQEVLQGLAAAAPADQLTVTRKFRLLQGTVEVHVEVEALHAQHVAEEELGVQAVVRYRPWP